MVTRSETDDIRATMSVIARATTRATFRDTMRVTVRITVLGLVAFRSLIEGSGNLAMKAACHNHDYGGDMEPVGSPATRVLSGFRVYGLGFRVQPYKP